MKVLQTTDKHAFLRWLIDWIIDWSLHILTDLDFLSFMLKYVNGLAVWIWKTHTHYKIIFPISCVKSIQIYRQFGNKHCRTDCIFIFSIVLQALQYVSDWDISFCLCHLFILLLSIRNSNSIIELICLYTTSPIHPAPPHPLILSYSVVACTWQKQWSCTFT